MAEVVDAGRKISAASARDHTRKQKSSSKLPPGIFRTISLVLLVGIVAWAYQAIQPPPPMICGSLGGPPVTAPRVLLKDGRHLAYKEHGVPKDKANYKIVYSHGFLSCRHDFALPQEFAEELGIYVVSFDRAGYGESDANPKRTLNSTALDIEELADQLGLGSKFYVVGYSMGGQVIWTCLKYIPHRLLGATLLTPVVNYWWPGFPAKLSKEVYYSLQTAPDQWAVRVAHYTPWLTYWWNTQKWFPGSAVAAQTLEVFSPADRALLPKFAERKHYEAYIKQQGEFDSLHRDMMIGFGTWEFDPMELENPFPNNEGSVHLWQGDEDLLVPVTLQRYIAEKLPWIQYHELNKTGHLFPLADGMVETYLRVFLQGGK